jgi:phospholipid/cholesterol/gamma-HCH transport system ATP-binding protein
MSEEKDHATMAAERAHVAAGHGDGGSGDEMSGIVPQLQPTPGLPERQAVQRRMDRVMHLLPHLPARARQEILANLTPTERYRYGVAATTTTLPTTGGRR